MGLQGLYGLRCHPILVSSKFVPNDVRHNDFKLSVVTHLVQSADQAAQLDSCPPCRAKRWCRLAPGRAIRPFSLPPIALRAKNSISLSGIPLPKHGLSSLGN